MRGRLFTLHEMAVVAHNLGYLGGLFIEEFDPEMFEPGPLQGGEIFLALQRLGVEEGIAAEMVHL